MSKYRRAVRSKSKRWSNTPHLTKVNVSRVRYLVEKGKNGMEN